MTRSSCSLALITTLALLPTAAQANPNAVATLLALRTVAVANDAGVAEAMVQPADPGTTKVTVVVSTNPDGPAPAATPEPPPPVYEPAPFSHQAYEDRKSGAGMLTAGLVLGTTSYVFTTLAGALTIDKARELTDDPLTEENEARHRADRRAFGRALLIPGIGPGLAIARADTAMRAWAAGFAGLTQAVSVGLVVVGIHRLRRARRLERMSFSAMGTSQEAHVSLRVRF